MGKKVFTAPAKTRVFYLENKKHKVYDFLTGKLETENGALQDACIRHPKVLEVKNAPIVEKPKKSPRIEAKKVEKKVEPKKEEIIEEIIIKSEESIKNSEKKSKKSSKK
jgi:hypothetical protein